LSKPQTTPDPSRISAWRLRFARILKERIPCLLQPVLESAKPDERLLRSASRAAVGKKIWIDLENTPHIPFFKPIIRELEQRATRLC